jgi:signal transduction histidine kinase
MTRGASCRDGAAVAFDDLPAYGESHPDTFVFTPSVKLLKGQEDLILGGDLQIGEMPKVAADPKQISLLFYNLISNGLKFHRPDEPPKINISSGESRDISPLRLIAKNADKICAEKHRCTREPTR